MKVRSLAGALLIGGTLALGPALTAPASAAPYPPTPCAGQTGILNASLTFTPVGGTVHFFACGFVPGRAVVVNIDGQTVKIVIADGDGSIDFTWTFTFQQTGLAQVSVSGPARFPTRAAGTRASGATANNVNASFTDRVLGTKIHVLPASVTQRTGGSGNLPFSDVETGALAALALALAGGGVGMRVLARRREGTAND
ncbi:MAG: hypothetical protein ACQSGP_17090 [Frankia sp.]